MRIRKCGKNIFGIMSAALLALALLLTVGPRAAAKPGDLGEPLGSYNMGSARTFTGKNVIVSLFVDTMYLRWTDKERQDVLATLSAACGYLSTEAEKAGADVTLIYDWTEYPDLRYGGTVFFPMDDGNYYTDLLDHRILFWLTHKVSYEELIAQYEADGIVMMLFFREEGRSYAICYDGEDIYEETLVLFSGSNAATYAHELLHLYGAHDLYMGAEYTDDCVTYIKKKYPNELMLSVTEDDPFAVTKEISPITAYHIGWQEELADIEQFPQLSR